MSQARECPRRRCVNCRRWYCPHAAATKHQKTCSESCRREHRRKNRRRRRERAPEDARRQECVWQRRSRLRRAKRLGEGGMSGPGLPAEVALFLRDMAEMWDKKLDLSGPGLLQEVVRVARVRGLVLGQVGTGTDNCQVPAF